MAATGSALDWLAGDLLGGAVPIEQLIAEAASVPPGADGLTFLPYLAGERSPLWDPNARGVLAGLTLAHGRAHVTRAILEAAALAIRQVAQPMLAVGVHIGTMRVCGGPAHSETWNQIKADATGFEVGVPRVLETTVLGAAIVAAVGIGQQPDTATAIRAMTSLERLIEPDPSTRIAYDDAYRRYIALWPAVRPVLEGRSGALAVGST
jgi:xylulokinase